MNQREITPMEMGSMHPKDYILVDIRSEAAHQNGHIPGAIRLPVPELEQGDLPRDRPILLYCAKGLVSVDAAQSLRGSGYQAMSLSGGYLGWLLTQEEGDKREKVEESLRKTFHKTLFSQFTKALRDYQLVEEGDKIAVCISGGKDSMLLAKLFQELKRHRKVRFELVFLAMDPGYAPENRAIVERNAKTLGIPLTIFETDIFAQVVGAPKSACYLCARMRRGHLYSKAKELGCNKIALGHHYDDVIETILMGMLYGAQAQTMMPKLKSQNFPGMELIRPMYLIREKAIQRFRDYHHLHFIQCACHFTNTCDIEGGVGSKRMEIKRLIRELKKTNPAVESNIFNSVENVSLEALISYKKDGKTYHFLDGYQNRETE